jgi:broad specificity phosphatase PhoE
VLDGTPWGTMSRAAAAAGIPADEYAPEGGESIRAFRVRVAEGLQHVLSDAFKRAGTQTAAAHEPFHVALVSHGGFILDSLKTLRSVDDGLWSHVGEFHDSVPPNCSVSECDIWTDEHGHIHHVCAVVYNHVEHLADLNTGEAHNLF